GEAERVSARLENRRYRDLPIEDTAEVVLEFPPGPGPAETRSDEESARATASHGNRSLASLGMTLGVEELGMTLGVEELGVTLGAENLGMPREAERLGM